MLTTEELILRLHNEGMEESVAKLAVYMHTYGYKRAEQGIIGIVRHHAGLEDPSIAMRAVTRLKRMKWLVTASVHGRATLAAAPDIARKMAIKLNDPSLEGAIQQLRIEPDRKSVNILGAMIDPGVYETFLEALGSAKSEICLPMLATAPDQDSLPIIQERARKGVRVRILLGSPELVIKLRGETSKQRAEEAVEGWRKSAKGIKRMEVRIVHTTDDMLIASCLSVDANLLRFDVFNIKKRTLEGMMLQVEPSESDITLNLIRLFQLHFDDVWRRAEPTGIFRNLWWRLAKGWQWWSFGVFALLGVAINDTLRDTFWVGVMGSVAATFLFNAIVASAPAFRTFFRRLFP